MIRVKTASPRETMLVSKHSVWNQVFAALLLGVSAASAGSVPSKLTADLLVVGGTESGCAAAVQAARMGVTNIVLVSDIAWLGGQFSSEALTAIDENREGAYNGTVPIPRSGLFREIMDRIEAINSNAYSGFSRPGNTHVITTCLPSDAEQVFRQLLEPYEAQGRIARYSGYYPTQALVSVDGVTLEGLAFAPTAPGGTALVVRAGVTIDASDWGDAIRLSGAAYDFGPDLQSDYGEPSAPALRANAPLTDMNPVTYCQIVIEQTNNTPIPMPAGYDARNFSTGAWSGLGFDQAYTARRLIDRYAYPQISHPDAILLNNPHGDYPLVPLPTNVVLALEALEPGAASKNIVEMTREQRQVLFDDAKRRSLGYLYYLQTVVHSNLVDKTHSFLHFALSDEFGTPDRLPPKPYVRESLRLMSEYVVRQQDTQGWSPSGVPQSTAFARTMYHDAVLCWQFEYDFHPTRRTFSGGGDPAGPWYGSFAGDRTWGKGGTGKAVFPLRALVPARVDGLLGAQKNLGMTSIVSSSLRLHDQCVAVGQAAGAAAAVALARGVRVRELPWRADLMADVWNGLLRRDGGAAPVALWPFADIPPEHEAYPAVNQLAVRGLLPMRPAETTFRASETPQPEWLAALSNRVVAAGYTWQPGTWTPPPATRGAAATAVWNALSAQQPPAWTRLSADDADLDGRPDTGDPLPFNTNAVTWSVSLTESQDGLPSASALTNAGWRGFNFTPSGAAAWSPFEQDTGAAYTNSRGYGWLADLSSNTRLRNIYPEVIRDTFVFTRYQDTWQCAVSNGTYDVAFCVGDAGYDQPDQNVAVEGLTVLSNVDTSAGMYCESNATVTVADGFLTVTIGRTEGGANTALNWLHITAQRSADEDTSVTRPDALRGLALWAKADAGITTNAEGRVTRWADQSGRGHDAWPTNAPPTFVASEPGLNNRPVIRFNGSGQKLTVASRILTNGIEGCTIIAMAKADIDNNPSIVGIRTGSGYPFAQLDQDGTGHLRFIVKNPSGSTANALSSQIHTGTYGMYAGILQKGPGTTWTNRVYFSKTTPEAEASANFGSSPDFASGDQYIGGLAGSYWVGDIAEIVIYERALSEVELGLIEAYLASRYKVRRAAEAAAALAEIPGLKLRLRADACAYEDLFADDPAEHLDVARLWSDATTNDHDAVALQAPTLVTNRVNGLPALEFSPGGSARLSLRDEPIATDPDQLTVFAVFRQAPGDKAQNMVFTHRNAPTPLIQASFKDATNAVLQVRGSGNVLRTITAPGLLTNGAFNIVMYQFDVVNDLLVVAVNGGTEVIDTYDFGAQTFIADTQRIGCYDYNGADGLFFHGFLAELLVYEGVALSFNQKNAIGHYLACRYGLTTGYVPSGSLFSVR